jgi:hypothetical protein
MADVTKEQPQVTVRGIPQNQYNSNVAASTQDPAEAGPDEGGIKGHLKKNWPIYTVVLAIVTIIVMVWLNNRNQSSSTTGYDTSGYGTGNSSSSDLYGSQLDSDYQQMINENNITNALLQQLLNNSGTSKTKGGSSGSGSSSGSSHHHKGGTGTGGKSGGGKTKGTGGSKGKGKPGKTKGGGNTGGSSGGYHHGSTGGGHNKSTSTQSRHAVAVSHGKGQTHISHNSSSVKPNPHAGGAKGWVYTTKPGDTVSSLTRRFWPGSSAKGGKGNPNLITYANNKNLLKGHTYKSPSGQHGGYYLSIKPGTKVIG